MKDMEDGPYQTYWKEYVLIYWTETALLGKKVLSLMHIVEKYINLLSHRVASWYKLVQIVHCFPSIVSLRRRKFLEMNNKKPRSDVDSGNNHEGIKV